MRISGCIKLNNWKNVFDVTPIFWNNEVIDTQRFESKHTSFSSCCYPLKFEIIKLQERLELKSTGVYLNVVGLHALEVGTCSQASWKPTCFITVASCIVEWYGHSAEGIASPSGEN